MKARIISTDIKENKEFVPHPNHGIRKGKYGKFVACSNYPECKYVKKEEKKEIDICKCPNCEGTIIERKTKKGKIFYSKS